MLNMVFFMPRSPGIGVGNLSNFFTNSGQTVSPALFQNRTVTRHFCYFDVNERSLVLKTNIKCRFNCIPRSQLIALVVLLTGVKENTHY